jgi:hypothetical protein
MVVTYEAWTNAKSDPSELEKDVSAVIDEMSERPEKVFLVTTRRLASEPLTSDIKALDDPSAWEPFELSSSSSEADETARRFLKTKP